MSLISKAGGLWSSKAGAVGFSSKSNDWSTPQEFYNKLDAKYGFTLDPCATATNAKCTTYFTEADDGLTKDWSGHTVFVNPPYGANIGDWLKKGLAESQKPNTVVVMLVPSRTDTKWWHNYVMKATEVNFVRGRLKFGGSKNAAPFPSAVVVFGTQVLPSMKPMERI